MNFVSYFVNIAWIGATFLLFFVDDLKNDGLIRVAWEMIDLPLTTVQCIFSASSTFPCTKPGHRLRWLVAVAAAAVALDAAPLDGPAVDWLDLVDSSAASDPVTSPATRHCLVGRV